MARPSRAPQAPLAAVYAAEQGCVKREATGRRLKAAASAGHPLGAGARQSRARTGNRADKSGYKYGVELFIAVLLYIFSFAIGFGPVFWLMSSEVFPTRLRGTGEGVSAFFNWLANFAVGVTFLTLIGGIGPTITFWIFAFFCIVTIVFAMTLVPETKNKPLEQVEVYWTNGRDWDAAERAAAGERQDEDRSPGRLQPAAS